MFEYGSVEAFMEVASSDLHVNPADRKRCVQEVEEKGFVKERELRLKDESSAPLRQIESPPYASA